MFPGVYAVVLTTTDNAGNHQTARRFLIFDNVNVVSINTAEDKVLVVNSVAKNTSYTWLTSPQSANNTGDQVSNFVWLMLAYTIDSSRYSFKNIYTFVKCSHVYIHCYLAMAIFVLFHRVDIAQLLLPEITYIFLNVPSAFV